MFRSFFATCSEVPYFPFGQQASDSGQGDRDERMNFTGHERDTPRLGYMRAFFLRTLGPFLSVDPMVTPGAIRSPQLWNRYVYVGNRPLIRIDPTGMCDQDASFIGPRAPCATLAPPKNAANWTPEQRAAENAKNADRDARARDGKIKVNRGQQHPSTAKVAQANGGPAPQRAHLDHTEEIVLDGDPLLPSNIKPLDATVNTSNGSRVRHAIARYANGTILVRFHYTVLSWGGGASMLLQALIQRVPVEPGSSSSRCCHDG